MEDVWDKDLLHVTYNPEKITLEQLQAAIREEEFTPEIRIGGTGSSEGDGIKGDEHGE